MNRTNFEKLRACLKNALRVGRSLRLSRNFKQFRRSGSAGTPRPTFFRQALRVYRLSEDLADAIWDLVREWDQFAKDTVGKQIVRCADSIGANIAEGTGRGSFQDNRRFVRTARGSLNETQHFLRRAFRRNLLSPRDVTKLKPLVDNLAPQLNAYLKSIGRGDNPDAD